jgi:phage terminase large subunit GpA-like protein
MAAKIAPRAEELMASVLAHTMKAKTRLNTHEWAGKNVRLDARFTARPGMYDVNFTPYMRVPYEWFSDPHVEEFTFAKSRQVGGTTFLANCMMFAVAEDPGPCLYVTSTGDNAQSFSEREWIPRVDLCEALVKLKPDNEDDFKKKEQHFKTCTVKFVGSNSPSNLMSRAIRYLFEDEIDTWPQDNGADAPSNEIAEATTLSYAHTKKILRVSTPTVPGGTVWACYLRGSQHKYHVPCPHCGHRFELLFEHLNFHRDQCRDKDGVWDFDQVEQATTLRCPNLECRKDIEQYHQPSMVAAGVWVQTNLKAPRKHISAHISALYSPTMTWGQVAAMFLQKKDTVGGLHDFYNHYLGLPFEHAATTITLSDIDKIIALSPPYHRLRKSGDMLPADIRMILMFVDVQQTHFWWGQRGFCLDKSSYLLDYGQASAWEDLLILHDRRYMNPHTKELVGLYNALIDSGFIAKRVAGVYDFCIQSGGRFFPCQGRSSVHGLFQPIRETQFEHRGILIDAVQHRDDLYKEELYIRTIKEHAGAPWYLPQDTDAVYKRQLTDERLTEDGWVPSPQKLNHLGDVEKGLKVGESLIIPFLEAMSAGSFDSSMPAPESEEGEIVDDAEDADARYRESLPRSPRESVMGRGAVPWRR